MYSVTGGGTLQNGNVVQRYVLQNGPCYKRYMLQNGTSYTIVCVKNGTVIKWYVLQNGNVTKLDVTTRYMLLDSTFSILYYECTNPWIS